MYPFNRFLVLTSFILVFAGLSGHAKAALVKYSYIANPFTEYTVPSLGISKEIPPDPSQVLSMWFIVDDALVPRNGRVELRNLYTAVSEDNIIEIVDYAGSIGSQIYWRPGGSRLGANLRFDTDAEGNVSGNWYARTYDLFSAGITESTETAEGCG
jgi:hypothetical protein